MTPKPLKDELGIIAKAYKILSEVLQKKFQESPLL